MSCPPRKTLSRNLRREAITEQFISPPKQIIAPTKSGEKVSGWAGNWEKAEQLIAHFPN
jgi:hypothetical protein